VALEREGYEVSVQATGEDALANFADAAPDLVVLDVRLPGIDGFEVLRQLRRETRAPVLFLTARADEVDKVVELERRRVTRDGQRIGLTTTEFDLLRHLASRPGRVYTRSQLLELVRDYDDALEQDERTINVHISHIRDKVEPDPSQPRYIRTVRGVGYAFAED
jgi:DNA-binding response OmpR family regulator